MSVLGITLLVLGVIIFAVSFFLPDKEENVSRKDKEMQKEEIRRMMEKELDGMKLRVNEATNETVKYGMDECERSLERISNEKIMAVSEYATTIMEEMDNNHKEIMFLYDMLNNKQVDLKNTVRKAEATAKEVDEMVTGATSRVSQNQEYMNQLFGPADDNNFDQQSQYTQANQPAQYTQPAPQVSQQNQYTQPAAQVSQQNQYAQPAAQVSQQNQYVQSATQVSQQNQYAQPAAQTTVAYHGMIDESIFESMTRNDIKEPEVHEPQLQMPPVTSLFNSAIANENALQFENEVKLETIERIEEPVVEEISNTDDYRAANFNESGNNNQKILQMYDSGMEVVDIARELNLGVGEVKLVIDLFKF